MLPEMGGGVRPELKWILNEEMNFVVQRASLLSGGCPRGVTPIRLTGRSVDAINLPALCLQI